MNTKSSSSTAFTGYQKFAVSVLAFLQFTIILDFMILAPLGAILMPAMKITTAQFGLVVSVYAFSAGAAGLLAAGFADRFDRKRLLLFFYAGFILGTFLCGIANTFKFLLFARMITGLFGGVIGSIVFAITTDLFPLSMRGRVMGVVQTSFAASQVLGIPFGIYLSSHWGWHTTFLMIVAVSLAAGAVISIYLKPIDGHLKMRPDRSAIHHLFDTATKPRYLHAFAATALLSIGGFMMMPFSSAFSVNNLGITMEKLPVVYMVTGLFNIVLGPIIGRLSDSVGKFNTFCFGSVMGVVMVLIYTHLGITPLWMVIFISVLMFTAISSRMIASSALLSAIPDPVHRGSFMSMNSSIQQIAGGIASVLAGMIVVQSTSGPLKNFDTLGYVVISVMLVALVMMFTINRVISRETA